MGYEEAEVSPNIYKPNVTAKIKEDLAAGKVIIGTMFRNLDNLYEMVSPMRTIADLGYRFVVFDCEHMAFNIQTVAKFAKEAHKVGISFWVRPEQSEHAFISRYADIGSSGFMTPNVQSTDRAQNVVNQAYYHPIARDAQIARGYSLGAVVLDGQKFLNMREQLDYANANMFVAVQTEHPKGIKNLADILSIEGINGTIIGPNDLARNIAAAMKNEALIKQPFNEMYRHELMMEAYRRIGEIANQKRKFAGIHFSGIKQMDLAEMLVREHGYRLMMLGTDSNFTDREILTTKERIEQIK